MHTARAPSASALAISVPRRKPEIDQHGNAAADRLEDLGQRVDGRAAAVLGAAAVVGHDDGIEPVVDGEDGVLGRHQSLQHQPRLHRVAQALDELPGEVGGAGAGDARHVEPVEVGLALDVARQAERVTRAAISRVAAQQPHQCLPVLPGQHVGRHHDGLRAGLLGAPRQALGHFPFVRRIELEPHRPAARLDRLLDRGRGHRREHLQVIALAGGARDRELAVLVEGLVGRRGRQHDRAGIALAEQFHAQVQGLDVDHAPRPELELQEALAVGAQRDLAVDAGRHVAEMRRRHVLVHDRLEVEDVDGLARRGDQLVERACAPHRGIGQALLLRQGLGGAGQQRSSPRGIAGNDGGRRADRSCSSGPRASCPLMIMSEPEARGPAEYAPTSYCRSAQPIMRAMKPSQASICDRATNSLGWWACEMSPGPQITVGMPWPRKIPASVP